jgi:hypothetical protein
MIRSLIPILTTHKISFDIKLKDDHLHITYLPKLLNKEDAPKGRENITEEDEKVLEQPLWGKFPIDEFSEEEFVQKLLDWSNSLIEGWTDLSQIKENIKSRVASKASTTKAKAPPRKTKKQEMDEAREKQAKERADQGDLFKQEPEEDRLASKTPKTPVKSKEELKTAAEKAVERVTQKPVSQTEEPKEETRTATITTDEDPFGLNDL